MNKVTLERFVNKYNLSGATEAVKWKSDDKGLHIHFCTEDKNLMGFVTSTEAKLDAGDYNIFETAQFRNLLSVLGDEITIQVKKDQKGPFAFLMNDGTVKVLFALSDSSAIPAVPVIKGLPVPEVTVKIDAKFRDAFVRAKGALPDVEDFAVVSDGSTAQIVLGHDPQANTHNVAISLDTVENSPIDSVRFNAKLLKEVLVANKEMPNCIMSISVRGVAHLKFENDLFVADYYLVQKNN